METNYKLIDYSMKNIDINREIYRMEELIRRADPKMSVAEHMFTTLNRIVEHIQELETRSNVKEADND